MPSWKEWIKKSLPNYGWTESYDGKRKTTNGSKHPADHGALQRRSRKIKSYAFCIAESDESTFFNIIQLNVFEI